MMKNLFLLIACILLPYFSFAESISTSATTNNETASSCDVCDIIIGPLHVTEGFFGMTIIAPESVLFDGFACQYQHYTIDFGDGTPVIADEAGHFYSEPGVYNACFTFSMLGPNGELCEETSCVEVIIPADCEDCEVTLDPFDIEYTTNQTIDVSLGATGYNFNNCRFAGLEWDFGDGTTMGIVADAQHTYSAPGSYEVCLTLKFEHRETREICEETICETVLIGLILNPWVGTRKVAGNPITISPNPATTTATINIVPDLDNTPVEQAVIYHISGKQMATYDPSIGNSWEVDVRDFPVGIYFVRTVDSNGKTQVERFVKAE